MKGFFLGIAGVLLGGCVNMSVVYPVCTYSKLQENDWNTFALAASKTVQTVFGNEAKFSLSETKRTLIVDGSLSEHEKFRPWWIIEACIPNYKNSTDRGAFVVCTSFMENAVNTSIRYSAEASHSQGFDIPPTVFSNILRDMDARPVLCQQHW